MPEIPPGVTSCTITYGKALGFRTDVQAQAAVDLTLTADRSLTHVATGWTFHSAAEKITVGPGRELSFSVPHVDQDGFNDSSGHPITMWSYRVTGTVRFIGGASQTIDKILQPLVGTDTLDLADVPDGPPTSPVTSPSLELQEARDARDLAEAAAAAAQAAAGVWEPTTTYAAGAVAQAPDGSRIKRKTPGTSRATFDATEQDAWTPVSADPTTFEGASTPRVLVDAQAGSTDDAKAQAAITAAAAIINAGAAQGAVVQFTPGKLYNWSKIVPKIPCALPHRLTILADGATIKLSGRSFADGQTSAGTPTLVSPALAAFTSADIGCEVAAQGIPKGTTILSVESATSCTMSRNAGSSATGIPVSLGAVRFLDPDLYLQPAGVVVQNVRLSGHGATIDCNNVASSDHVIFGNWIGGSVGRIGLNHIRIEGFRTINVPTEAAAFATTYVKQRAGVSFQNSYTASSWIKHASCAISTSNNTVTDASIAAGDAGKQVYGVGVPPNSYVGTVTPGASFLLVDSAGNSVIPLASATVALMIGAHTISDQFLDVTCRDLDLTGGGDFGVLIAGNTSDGNTAAPLWYDEINVINCRHDTLVTPTQHLRQASFEIGNHGFGGRALIENCWSNQAGDDAFEIDSAQDARIIGCHAVDSAMAMYYFPTFHPFKDLQSARLTIKDCAASHLTLGTTSATPGRGYSFDAASTGLPMCKIIYDNVKYRRVGNAFHDTADQGNGVEALSVTGPHTGIEGSTFHIAINGYVLPAATATQHWLCNIAPSNSPNFFMRTGKWYFHISGSQAHGTAQIWTGIALSPANSDITSMTFDIDGFVWDFQQTYYGGTANAGAYIAIRVGTSGSGSRFASMSRINGARIVSTGADVSSKLLLVNSGALSGTTFPGRLVVSNSDTRRVSDTTAFQVNNTADAALVKIENHKWAAEPKLPAAVTLSGSPFVWQNTQMMDGNLTIQGGTVTKVEYSADGTTYYDIGAVAGMLAVRPGHYVRITYSVAPTVTFFFSR